ncbi:MAG: prepilin-type N-terminal cleavage/methylation domain-containing protein [Candidatus Omnitrophica bacterium]|nr:prepilin-type N-terminal cleavage/methylation domain-containing protein [Candidatus Omnitrophota bacterium]MDD5592876.1 prepilin-type N-terminal cleavage/methylation domain-containing protein [Candidatus Omnitrophota bacterium]
MKKGFTLLELIVVIIIIGILATLGITQYASTVERSRVAEAKANLGSLRTLQLAYFQDKDEYASVANLEANLPTDTCTSQYYFKYSCDAGGNGTGECTATRCGSAENGKSPGYTGNAYNIRLEINGEWNSDAGW